MPNAFALGKGARVVVFATNGLDLMQRLVIGARSHDEAAVFAFGHLRNDDGSRVVTEILAVVPSTLVTEKFERDMYDAFVTRKYKEKDEGFVYDEQPEGMITCESCGYYQPRKSPEGYTMAVCCECQRCL